MSYTGLEIFNMSVAIMDALSDTGAVTDAQTKDYKYKAPYLLDLWQHEDKSIQTTIRLSTLAYDPPADFREELRKCRWYYEEFPATGQLDSSGGIHTMRLTYKEEKRVNPTVAFYDNEGNLNKISVVNPDWSKTHNIAPLAYGGDTRQFIINHNISGANGFEISKLVADADL